ncbi:unnamed protein product [Leptosia nina]|uniref:Uncharacterized protein n=1 Tax=Leptosia nina TaxID=320188 RepID=A0AAV1J6F3_9NEOP
MSMIILITGILCSTAAAEDVFEFGRNRGIVSFTKSGSIGLLEKHVQVPIVLPQCMDLQYVRVSVDNWVGPPKVDFDSEVNTVNIKYRRLQHSASTYTVIAKAKREKNCRRRDDYEEFSTDY